MPFSETKISHATIPIMTETSQNDTVVFRNLFFNLHKIDMLVCNYCGTSGMLIVRNGSY